MGNDSQARAFVFVLVFAVLLLIASAKRDQARQTEPPAVKTVVENSTR